MDQSRAADQLAPNGREGGFGPGREGGFASVQFVIAAALAMVMVVGLSQLIAYQYARGAALAALERGVRAGSVAGAGESECLAAVADSFEEVLGGSVGETLVFGCVDSPELVRAQAVGAVPAWLPGGPLLAFEVEAIARREAPP